MKAVAYKTPGPIDREDALQDITLEKPKAEGGDLLVKVTAVSVNPVDTQLRLDVAPENGDWRVLGFDATGIVEAVGPEVQNFKPGDAVFYADSIARPGNTTACSENGLHGWKFQRRERRFVKNTSWARVSNRVKEIE